MVNKPGRFEKLVNLVSGWLNWITIAGLVAISLVTLVDVVAAKVLRVPVLWSYEVTGLLGLVVLVFAVAFTQLGRGHIEIEFVTGRLPVRAQRVIGAAVALVGVALFAVMTWRMFDHALSLQETSRVTPIEEIPLPPFAYGATFCFLVVFLVLLLQFFKAVAEVVKK